MAMHSAVKGKLLAVIGDEVSIVTKVIVALLYTINVQETRPFRLMNV